MTRIRLPNLRKTTSVRTRLTLWNVLALTAALVALGVQIRLSVGANILASIDLELSSMARSAGRTALRRQRMRLPGSMPGGGFAPPSLSGTMRRVDAQIGQPTPRGTAPSAIDPTSLPGIGVSSETATNGQQAPVDTAQNAQPAAPDNAQAAANALAANNPTGQNSSPAVGVAGQAGFPFSAPGASPGQGPPTRSRRGDAIPNSPATRVLVNGARTFSNEPPWDMGGYQRSVNENRDVFSTMVAGDRSNRIVSHPVHGMGGSLMVVQCTFPLSEKDRAIHSLDITLLTTIPLVLLIAGLGGAFLTDRAMRPVRHITRTAEQISAEDLSRRLPVGSDDEFAQLAGTFNAMLGRLETSFEQQRRFTADASHELKSPLTVIKANASLALRSPRTGDEYVRRLEAIDRASNHMRVLVDDLLLLARADEGRIAVDKEVISLTELLREAVESTQLPDAALVSLELPDEPMTFVGDRRDLLRVFRNLIDNAQRFTGSSGSIIVRATDEGVALCVMVSDTGEGIASEHIDHLGERFYRVEVSRARTHGGSGLGLAICRSIIEAHHGTLSISSQEQVGTTVSVTLPTSAEV